MTNAVFWYTDKQFLPHRRQYVSATEPSRLMLCKIWGFHGGAYEECHLPGCDTVLSCKERRFGGTYLLHDQSEQNQGARNVSSTSVLTRTTRRHTSEDGILSSPLISSPSKAQESPSRDNKTPNKGASIIIFRRCEMIFKPGTEVDSRLWSMVYGLWSVVYGIWYVVYGLWSMVCGLWSMVYGL
jgi:hypothetical protein